MSPSQNALFIIDVQHENALDPSTQVPDAATLLDTIAKVLKHARTTKPPIQIIHVQHDDSDPDEGLYPGSKGWGLVFAPEDGEWHYRKTVGDVFKSNPDLSDRLKEGGMSNLIICGIQTDCCVRASSLGAVELGFHVTLLAGAHSTYPCDGKTIDEIKEGVERELEGREVNVVPWDTWTGEAL